MACPMAVQLFKGSGDIRYTLLVIKSWSDRHANLPDRARWYPKMRPSGNQSVKRQPTSWWAFLRR